MLLMRCFVWLHADSLEGGSYSVITGYLRFDFSPAWSFRLRVTLLNKYQLTSLQIFFRGIVCLWSWLKLSVTRYSVDLNTCLCWMKNVHALNELYLLPQPSKLQYHHTYHALLPSIHPVHSTCLSESPSHKRSPSEVST